jgi:pyrimidine-nucleoside phosphorylase
LPSWTELKTRVRRAGGYVYDLDALAIGMASLGLGAGRRTMGEKIDHLAGILLRKKVGDEVREGEVLAELRTERKDELDAAKNSVTRAFTIRTVAPPRRPLIHSFIDRGGLHPWPLASAR